VTPTGLEIPWVTDDYKTAGVCKYVEESFT